MEQKEIIQNLHDLHRETKIKFPIDGLMSALSKKLQIDIIKTDELLKKQFSDYTDEYSMSEFIKYKFGERLHKKFESLFFNF